MQILGYMRYGTNELSNIKVQTAIAVSWCFTYKGLLAKGVVAPRIQYFDGLCPVANRKEVTIHDQQWKATK